MLDGRTVTELHRDNIMNPCPARESDSIYTLNSLLEQLGTAGSIKL